MVQGHWGDIPFRCPEPLPEAILIGGKRDGETVPVTPGMTELRLVNDDGTLSTYRLDDLHPYKGKTRVEIFVLVE